MTAGVHVSLSLCIKEISQVDQHDSVKCDVFNMGVIV